MPALTRQLHGETPQWTPASLIKRINLGEWVCAERRSRAQSKSKSGPGIYEVQIIHDMSSTLDFMLSFHGRFKKAIDLFFFFYFFWPITDWRMRLDWLRMCRGSVALPVE